METNNKGPAAIVRYRDSVLEHRRHRMQPLQQNAPKTECAQNRMPRRADIFFFLWLKETGCMHFTLTVTPSLSLVPSLFQI